jgi:hypothetical protein
MRQFRVPGSRKVTLRVKFDTAGLDSTLEKLDQLIANPMLIAQLLRQAVAETLLTAYRKRFLDNFEAVLSPEHSKNNKRLAESPTAADAKVKLVNAYQELAQADSSGDAGALKLAATKIRRLNERLVKASANPGGQSDLSTGQFREMALGLLRTLTDASLVTTQVEDNTISVGIGYLPALEAVETPSATPKLTGHPTASKLTSMWRQIEFGTGIYSKLPGGARGVGWWYGPHPGVGLQMLGARGVQAVFDAATGLPYEKDALQFEEVFAGLLGRALAGR